MVWVEPNDAKLLRRLLLSRLLSLVVAVHSVRAVWVVPAGVVVEVEVVVVEVVVVVVVVV
mgnify:CR=1 FL=1